ncbi:MAG TPA: Asp-tRNA(Asn)/Glu-tRNA(Gln) amidotransferase subunit GatA [Chloroflexota bacterium]
MFDSPYTTIEAASLALHRREVSSVELTEAALARSRALDDDLHAFLLPTPDVAILQARQADNRLARGEGDVLTGVPMALKDILSTRGIRTTCGSRILESYVPQYDATVVQRLHLAGAVLLGKTNMDEFAMGSSNENSAFGPVHNPWDTSRVPGGSSGGSATAVAAGEAVFALGTDTGGSIRQPAALTGTVGLKPTYGQVSRFGLVAFGSSLDQIGPITRSVADSAIVLECIAGHDPRDSTSLSVGVPNYRAALSGDVRGMKLGVPREYFGSGMQPEVEQAVRSALDVFSDLGASVEEVSLPHTDYALSTYYIISPAEAMANLARYDGVRYGLSVPGDDIWEMFERTREKGFGKEVKRRILLGTYALSAGYYDAYYVKAQRVRTLVRRDFDEVFASVDALVAPTTPSVAFPIGAKIDDPLEMYLSDVYTVPINIAGICAISIPAGFSNGLPIGLQIIGPALGEETILRVADAFEGATDFHEQHPRLEVVGAER